MNTNDPTLNSSPTIQQDINSGHEGQKSEITTRPFNIKLALIVLAIIIVISVGGYFLIKNQNSSDTQANASTTNDQSEEDFVVPSQTIKSQSDSYSSLNFKKPNEFFPINYNSFQVRVRGEGLIGEYKVLNLKTKEYKRPNDDRVAHFDYTYAADYVENNSDISTGFGLTVVKISNKDEVQVLSDLLDADIKAVAQGFKKVDMPLNDIKYWAIYRDVPPEKVKFAGDVSMIFPEALTYIRITVSSKYTLEQFKTIVNGYLSSITSDAAKYVSIEEIEP